MSTDPGTTTLLDLSGEAKAAPPAVDPHLEAARARTRMHLGIAARLMREGSALQGFQELVRTTRTVPMTARLAAALVRMSLASGTQTVAQLLIAERLDDALGDERIDIQRQLVRLARRAQDLERAQEGISVLLAERPTDRRARAVLNALLEQGQRWEELDASLEKETREAARRNHFKTAARASLRRARLWSETLNDPARAALRAMQAAQFSEQAKDEQSAFLLRLLWLRNLARARAPGRALDEAARVVLAMGQRVGQPDAAQALVEELGLFDGTDSGDRTVNSVETTPFVTTTTDVVSEETPTPAPAPPQPPPRRRSTQLELVAVAEAAEQVGRKPEAAAILAAAVREGADPRAAQKLEAHLIQRGAWRELAAFYRDAVLRSATPAEKAQWGEKLAELLESELNDNTGAARAWAEIAALTGDSRAVSEQVRLLNQKHDDTGVRAALDAGVKSAANVAERTRAHVLRAEDALTRRALDAARADFDAALKLTPGHPIALLGLAELAANAAQTPQVVTLARSVEESLGRVPRKTAGRGDLYRRLARLADSPLRDARMSRASWNEVVTELPADEEATTRLLALTRAAGDDVALEALILAALQREPRGPRPRLHRMELVTLLERAGREDEALEALKQATRMEPGHREAWLAYAERLISLERNSEAAWALEHAATATDDPAQRQRSWERLADFVRETLGDELRAQTYEKRVEKMRREGQVSSTSSPSLPPVPAAPPSAPVAAPAAKTQGPLPGGPIVIPPRRAIRARVPVMFQKPEKESFEQAAESAGLRREAPDTSRAHVRIAPRIARQLTGFAGEPLLTPRPPPPVPDVEPSSLEALEPFDDPSELGAPTRELPAVDPDEEVTPGPGNPGVIPFEEKPEVAEEVSSADVQLPDDEEVHEERRTAEVKVELGDPSQAIPPSFGPSPSRALSGERQALFDRVRSNPLEPDGYKLLAEHFDTANDPARSSLMLEVARALEGDPHAAPRAPRLILNATDRNGLRHPALRGEGGELLGLVGVALCRLNPARGKEAGTDDEFHLEAGKGARAVADALLSAVRILGVRSPDVFLSEEAGPPISLVFTDEPRLLIGKLAVKKDVSDAELRFFAGRALFTLQPDLLALRNIRREQLLRGLVLVNQVADGRASQGELKHFRDAVPERSWERLRTLVRKVGPKLDLGVLAEGARHSANRAGLVVCGGIAPAVASLRAKKALPSEMIELIRYAASERYLQLRNRNLPRR